MSSASSSLSNNWQYDVFVSFRGGDVRKKFLNHFLKELSKLISVFKDNLIDKGESLGPVLNKAIENSRIAIVIFSKNYASSGWCLNELLDIVRCKEGLDQLVIPIFYEIDPSQVRYQTGDFGNIFKNTCKYATKAEIELWAKALTKVANIVGYHSLNSDNEAKLIEDVVSNVLVRLNLTPSNDFEDCLGIEYHIGEMLSRLELETKPDSVKMVGIWGPSGIGKTTIARALYNRISHRFNGRIYIDRAFISMSRERYRGCNPDDHNMKLHWQGRFLSEILEKEGIKVEHLGAVRDKLNHQKVIIFIDDLDDNVVLEALADKVEWFGQGSRIVAITKDRQILKGHGIECVYEVGIPSKELALQMLCRSAFRNNPPPDGVLELASKVVEHIGALPLALTVLGSSLAGKERDSWEDILPTLRKGLDKKIEKALSISYQGLERKEHQALFRHIACFFNGCETKNIKQMLADSVLAVGKGLGDLVDKSLIHVRPSWNDTEIVEMHCLLQELGKEIVRAQSDKPGEREFLMDSKDICHVLEGCSGTENVLGISLDLDEVNMLKIDKDAFKRMRNLHFLKFYYKSLERKKEVIWKLPKRFNDFPEGLKLLSWPECPMEKMPSDFRPDCLVELRMPNSKLKTLWEGVKPLTCLKELDLSESKVLKKIPDLSKATNLETLKLYGCSSLEKLPSSIQNLSKVTELNLTGCSKLKYIPEVLMPSLIRLDLTGCSQLRSFPHISSKIESLTANKTAFKIFPSRLRLGNLVELQMYQIMSEKLWEGPQPFTSLKKMVLGSKNLKEIPDLSMATNLQTLNLNGCSNLVELTFSSFHNLHKLTTLEMVGCSSLETLPTGINLKSLYRLNLKGCSRLSSFPDISTNISRLDLNQTAIKEVPPWIEKFISLESMDMMECKYLETLPNGIDLKSLYRLNLSGCSRLKSFPDFSSNILTLFLNQTAIEEVPPWITNFPSLEALEMWGCKELKLISPKLFTIKNLDEVFFSDCQQLAEVRWPEEAQDNKFSMISFTDCFNLNQENFIHRSTSDFLILPGEVLPYFTHRSTDSSLTIPLHHSPLSYQSLLNFKACIVVSTGSETVDDNLCFFMDIKVEYRFKDKPGEYLEPAKQNELASLQACKYNHQIIFDCRFPPIQGCEQVEIVFHLPKGLKLEECGMRLLDYFTPANQNQVCEESSDDEGYETAPDEAACKDNSEDQGLPEPIGSRLTKLFAK